MPTPNFNLPLIDGASPISIVNDMNSLATAADSAMGKLATQGDISAIRTIANQAVTTATDAQKTADTAKGAADAAAKSAAEATAQTNSNAEQVKQIDARVSAISTTISKLESHTTFSQMARHARNPFPLTTWNARQSNDLKEFAINGFIACRPEGGGEYAKNSDVSASIVSIPGTGSTKGIPLYVLNNAPATNIILYCGTFHGTNTAATAMTHDNMHTTNLIIATDGIVYLLTQNVIGTAPYCFGSCVTGEWGF